MKWNNSTIPPTPSIFYFTICDLQYGVFPAFLQSDGAWTSRSGESDETSLSSFPDWEMTRLDLVWIYRPNRDVFLFLPKLENEMYLIIKFKSYGNQRRTYFFKLSEAKNMNCFQM